MSHVEVKTTTQQQKQHNWCLAIERVHLGESTLFIDERHDVHRLDGDHVQSILVVGELNVLPVDVLQVVFLLFQLEDMAHEKLLQVLVGKVDAELLKAAGFYIE